MTNGRVLYYSKNKSNKSIVYKMDLRTKKIYKLFTFDKKEYNILGGTDKYLYIGENKFMGTSAYKMYIYNIKTKKKTRELKYYVGNLQVKYNKVLITASKSEAVDGYLEVLTESGKRIFETNALEVFFAKGKLYYCQVDVYPIKCYQCDLNGKNRKRIKEKTYEAYEKKYKEYI